MDVVAWLALVVSIASFGWQVLTWRSAGVRLHVAIAATAPPGSKVINGYAIVVTNQGRQAAKVHDATLGIMVLNHSKRIVDSLPVPGAAPGTFTRSRPTWERHELPQAYEFPRPVEGGGDETVFWYEAEPVDFALQKLGSSTDDLSAHVRTGRKIHQARGLTGSRYSEAPAP